MGEYSGFRAAVAAGLLVIGISACPSYTSCERRNLESLLAKQGYALDACGDKTCIYDVHLPSGMKEIAPGKDWREGKLRGTLKTDWLGCPIVETDSEQLKAIAKDYLKNNSKCRKNIESAADIILSSDSN